MLKKLQILMRVSAVALLVFAVFINGVAIEAAKSSSARLLTFRPVLDSFHLYRTITRVDGSLTRLQEYQGLIGFTIADFRLVPKSAQAGIYTVLMNIHNYAFQAREFVLGEGGEGGGGRAGGGSAGGGSPGGGPGGGPSGPGGAQAFSGQTIVQVGMPTGEGPGGPGGPGGPDGPGGRGEGREGPPEEVSPSKIEISKLLQRDWQLIMNPHYEILGTRGVDFRRIREVGNISAVGMDQIIELAFLPYLPDRVVSYGDSWKRTKRFTLLGIRTPIFIELTYTIHPRIDIGTACELDGVICEMLSRGRPYLFRVLQRVLGLPGFAPYDTYLLAGVFASGSTDFDSSETEEIIDQEGGFSYTVERTFRGRAHIGALFLYDVTNSSLFSLAVSEYVQYFRKERKLDVASLGESEEREPPLEYFNYILDTDLLRATYEGKDLSVVVSVGR